MNTLKNELHIDDTYTKLYRRPSRPDEQTHVKDNIPLVPDYNDMADILLQKCNINIPWLRNADLDPSSIVQRVQEIMSLFPNMLPAFIMNPFNSSGVALHCVGLSIEGPHAVVMDPANASFFQLTMESLDTVCEGKWNGFRRIYCICSRNPKT